MGKVVIDAGHGNQLGKDRGAVGTKENGDKVHEGDIVGKIARMVSIMLEIKGFEVVQTRPDDTYVSLQSRTDIANRSKSELFVSIHLNAYNGSTSGIETLHYPTSIKGLEAATAVQEELIRVFPDSRDRGLKPRSNLHVLRQTNMPAILVEVEFIDSMADLVDTEKFIKKSASAIVEGILNYFE